VNGVKVVPQEIFNLLTPIALAHWISCDGSANFGRLRPTALKILEYCDPNTNRLRTLSSKYIFIISRDGPGVPPDPRAPHRVSIFYWGSCATHSFHRCLFYRQPRPQVRGGPHPWGLSPAGATEAVLAHSFHGFLLLFINNNNQPSPTFVVGSSTQQLEGFARSSVSRRRPPFGGGHVEGNEL